MIQFIIVAGWEPFDLHNLGPVSMGRICTIQILHTTSERQVRIYFEVDDLDDIDHDPVSYTHLTLPTIYSV